MRGAQRHTRVGMATEKDEKRRVLEELDIRLEQDSIEKSTLASGGFGSVHRARFVSPLITYRHRALHVFL